MKRPFYLLIPIVAFMSHPATAQDAYIGVTPTQKGKTIWLKKVTDEEYHAIK